LTEAGKDEEDEGVVVFSLLPGEELPPPQLARRQHITAVENDFFIFISRFGFIMGEILRVDVRCPICSQVKIWRKIVEWNNKIFSVLSILVGQKNNIPQSLFFCNSRSKFD